MSVYRVIASGLLTLFVGGCGTYVPDIQEIPGDSVGGQQLVHAIVRNIKCEVRDALNDVARVQSPSFLDKWGVQVNLELTVIEKGAANPTASWGLPATASSALTLGGGLDLSSEATRTDKIGMYYTVVELRRLGRCIPENRGGPWMLQSDLKLNQWLVNAVTAKNTGGIDFDRTVASGAFKDGVLSHQVKFVVTTGASLSPALTLSRVTLNSTGSTLSASRVRTHDLIITLGPTVLVDGAPGPARIASDAALASQIGTSVSNAVRSTR